MAVTTQRGSLTLVDKAGKPLRPFIIWLDQRRATARRPFRHGGGSPSRRAASAARCDYLPARGRGQLDRRARAERLERRAQGAAAVGLAQLPADRRFVDSIASQVGYLPFDFKRQAWARSWDWKWKALGVRREQLPELRPVGSMLGGLTRRRPRRPGIPGPAGHRRRGRQGLRGARLRRIEPDVGAVSYGTTATINVTTPRYLEAPPFVPPYPAALPGHFDGEVQIFRGYWMVRWFKEQFGDRRSPRPWPRASRRRPCSTRWFGAVPPGSRA